MPSKITETVALRIPKQTRQAIIDISKASGHPVSSVFRAAIHEFIDNHGDSSTGELRHAIDVGNVVNALNITADRKTAVKMAGVLYADKEKCDG